MWQLSLWLGINVNRVLYSLYQKKYLHVAVVVGNMFMYMHPVCENNFSEDIVHFQVKVTEKHFSFTTVYIRFGANLKIKVGL